MSATTSTKYYSLLALRFDEASEDLTGIYESTRVPLDLGFPLTLENQPTAKMIFASCFPKQYERFGRAISTRRVKKNEITVPVLVINSGDIDSFRKSLTLQDLRNRGLYQDDFT